MARLSLIPISLVLVIFGIFLGVGVQVLLLWVLKKFREVLVELIDYWNQI